MENFNIHEILASLTDEEKQTIEKGKKNWNMKVFQKHKKVKVESDTIQTLINLVIENTWVNAKNYYENK